MDAKTIRVRPIKDNLIIRKPPGGIPLKATGESVPNNSFWRRRMNDGDVVLMEDKPKSKEDKKEDKKK